MKQINTGGTNYQVETGENNSNFFEGEHHHYYAPPSPAAVGIPHNLPFSSVTHFVGRESELARLHSDLQQAERVAITAIRGMGGVGKTELAWQYAREHLEQQTYRGGVGWFRADANLGSEIEQFARAQLGLQPPEGLDLLSRLQFCWRHWPAGAVLLVIDDLTDYAAIQPYLPPADDRFKLLVTTRLQWGSSFRELLLEVLSETAALELLRSIVGTERIEAELETAKDLCNQLGYLPLGVELVARYLGQDPDLSLTKLQARLEAKRLNATALQQTYPGMRHLAGVAAAFEVSWQSLSQPAQTLAHWLSLFALAPMPWRLVAACLPDWDEEALETARQELVQLHLLQRPAPNTYLLHQLVREFFAAKRQQTPSETEMPQVFCRVIVAEAREIPYIMTLELVARFANSIPHLAEVATQLAEHLSDDDLITPSIRIAWFYQGQGLYEQAQPWLEQCCEVAESRLGENHPDVALSLNDLALLYDNQGRYKAAELLYQQALEMQRTLLGESHPNVALSLNNLAALYYNQGRYEAAEPLYQQALQMQRTLLGESHPDVAQSLNNLAMLYYSQGRYSEAEPLLQQALQMRKTLLGESHPAVATSLNNLAMLYRTQGRYEEAEPLYQQALQMKRTLLGENHPAVANSLNNLAYLYYAQGRYEAAEPLYQQALQMRRSLLGANHPDVAISLNNLAKLYYFQGRYKEAEPLYLQALSILVDRLGETHPHTQKCRENFRLLLQKAIEAGQTAQLSDHPTTQAVLAQLRQGE